MVVASNRQHTLVFANHSKHFESGNSFSSPSHIPTVLQMMNDASRLTQPNKTLQEHEKVPRVVQCVRGVKPFSHFPLFPFLHWGRKEKEKKKKERKSRPFTFPWTQGKWLSIKVISIIQKFARNSNNHAPPQIWPTESKSQGRAGVGILMSTLWYSYAR